MRTLIDMDKEQEWLESILKENKVASLKVLRIFKRILEDEP
jgi:hypothetical protein